MPVDPGGCDSPGFALPEGTYMRLLREQCERQCAPDARLFGTPGWEESKTAGAGEAGRLFELLALVGDPITVPAIACGVRDSRAATTVHVHADDWCEPASFYTGEMAAGRWELVELPPRRQVSRV